MAYGDMTGLAQTVTGPIDPGELGVTLTHEHLLVDGTHMSQEPSEASARNFYHQPLAMEVMGYIRHHAAPNINNFRVNSVETAIAETTLYKQYGGDTIVDATSLGIGRDPIGLARISRATGVNVIMGGSHYVDEAHPNDMDARHEDEIFEKIVEDVTVGVDGTGIKCGIIGEVGCTWPLTDNERKVMRASARAQQVTGAPILIHPGRDEVAPLEIVEVLSEAGADLENTIVGHLDRTIFERSTLKSLAESGCFLEWDLFGQEQSYYTANTNIDMPSDAKRMDDIAWISSQGYDDKIVVAHDICQNHRLVKYGGHGYFYILNHIVPRMRERGFSADAIDKILVDNPKEALAFR